VEVEKLTTLRAKVATLAKGEEEEVFNRRAFDELILRKMYIVQSFEIHNGPAGLFDYGPPATALKVSTRTLFSLSHTHSLSLLITIN
jgi:glycyl-tRNA synthetase